MWVQLIDRNPSFLGGWRSDKRQALMWLAVWMMTKADMNCISGFLCTTSSFTQVTLRELIGMTWDKQSQSSISIWATALMWQIWERWCVRDRRGTQWNSGARGLMPNQDWENWLLAPDTSPLCSAATLYMKHSPGFVSGGGCGSWPTFTPLFLSVSIRTNEFVDFPSYIWAEDPCLFILCLSFINLFLLSPSFIHNPSSLSGCVLKPLHWHIFLRSWPLQSDLPYCGSIITLVEHQTTHAIKK